MIERDRQLLADAAKVNTRLGQAVVSMVSSDDYDGALPADDVRAIGRSLVELGSQFLARAAELEDGRLIERVIIDART